MNYIDTVNNNVKEYFKVLEPEYPSWLDDYINTKELLKQQYIGMGCGTHFSHLYNFKYMVNSLDHSIGVALIVWHFTHDKKQTLSGLFHDIATPAFKHCIDFLNKDYLTQESTEELTHQIIVNSKEIMSLLKRDNINVDEVDNYHLYPIADNDTPRLSSDRLEYTFSNALLVYDIANLEQIKDIYNDIYVGKNEDNEDELSFKNKKLTRDFLRINSTLSVAYRDDKTRYSMQFLADIVKLLNKDNLITIDDLYNLKDIEVIDLIKKSKYKEIFNEWVNATKVKVSLEKPDCYFVKQKVKIRYVNPLVNGKRISDICKIANNIITKNLSYNMDKYVYIEKISIKY